MYPTVLLSTGLPASTPLNLTACLVSGIFQREITSWNDPSIIAVNPELSSYLDADAPISVIRRTFGSSSTAGISQYLLEATQNDPSCPTRWVIGAGKGGELSDDGECVKPPCWPSDTIKAEGSGGVSGALDNVPYAIGYVDVGHGRSASLHVRPMSLYILHVKERFKGMEMKRYLCCAGSQPSKLGWILLDFCNCQCWKCSGPDSASSHKRRLVSYRSPKSARL